MICEEDRQRLSNLILRGKSIHTKIGQEINSQAILSFAESIGKTLSMDLEEGDREWWWQAGGIIKGVLPDSIATVMEQYVDWYLECTLFFRELDWSNQPRVISFVQARDELASELQRTNPSLQVILKIVENQISNIEHLLQNPPVPVISKAEKKR